MFKSLSSRSTRPASSQSASSSTYTHTATSSSSSTTYTPLPALPPIPPSPERDTIPAIRLVSATPGKSPQSSPLLEKRRTRTLVPRRSVRGKENQPQSETSFTGSLETSTLPPVVDSMHVTGLVARQFAAHHDRQFHSVGPSTGLSLPLSSQEDSSSASSSLKVKSGLKHKRVLVESRAYPDGGQVEVVKDTIGRRSSKPALLESVRGTITGTVKGGTVRGENEENAGTSLVVKKKKSRGTLDSIRWALGDRTNSAARKAEKEKEKEGQAEEKERKKATSVAERPKATRPTINTHVPREVPLETPITSAVLSPMSAATTGTMTGVTTDSESAAASGGEKTGKWRWTIGKKRAKSPGPSLSSTFDRPAHVRSNSLDPNALMASLHPEESEEAAYTNLSPRASSLELPPLSHTAAAEEAAQNLRSPISSSRPMPVEASSRPTSVATSSRPTPVETAPVDFGFQPATVRKVSTGSVESGATRKSSIGSLLSGDNASNTGSFAIRAMKSVRSMASLARIGGWVKGDEDETEKVEKKEKKTGTVKEKKKRRLRKKVIVEEEDTTNTSGESWEAGELNRDPTITVTAPIGKPIGRQNVYVRDERADLGVRRISEGDEDWPRAGRRSSSGSSFAAPSTVSSGSYQQSRMSRASSDAHTVRSRQDSVPAAPNVPANPSIIFEHQEETPASEDGPSATYLGDNAWVGVGADTLKSRTRQMEQGAELGRRARKPVIGLFDIPTAEESQSKAPESPPHVEVRGTKIGKGCVRERVRAFEARVEENAGSSATFSASTGRKVSLPILPNATLGRAAVSEVNDQQLSFIQEREYTLSSKRCVSVPLPRPSTSPERPTRSRPWSEQMLRADDEAAIDILNAANSDLSDLISRLDLSATPDTKLASPETRRVPTWVEDSPSRRPRGEQRILTGLLDYNHPSLAKPAQKLLLAEPDDLFTPRALQLPPRATKASGGGVSAKSSDDSGRTRIESRHHTGMNTTFGEDSMLEGDDVGTPGSDMSDELQVLLLGGVETEQPLPSPGMPPNVPLPQPTEGVEIPRVVIEDTTETQLNVVLGSEYSEADEEMERGSRKSFDFTEELGQLKGGSRNSFVEVLVTAFNPPGTDIDEQLQLNVDSLNRLSGATERDNSVVTQEPAAHDVATEAEISFSRAEALAKLTRKSSDQLKLDFQFGPARETTPQEESAGTALADSTFALALANLSQAGGDKGTVKRRDATIRFKLDTDSSNTHGGPQGSSNSASSLGNLFHPATSDPFGFNPSQPTNTSRASRQSILSVPSVYRMPNIPQDDPFDYESLMRELDEASAMVDDPNHGLARRRRSKRMSVDSDRSSFYCRTNAPPVTFHNRGFGRHLGQSLENGSLGVNASRLSWGRHYPEESADSDRYDRPGLGDKMFQTGVEHGMPLPSIMASPTNSEVSTGPQFYYEQHTGKYSYVSDQRRNSYLSERRDSYAPSMVDQRRMSFASYDSLVDGAGDERRYSIDMESLYERRRSNSISSISVFGDDHRRRRHNKGGVQPGNFRPVSIISMQSDISARDDDTMVSMIGGTGEARVRRKSVGSTLLLDASPCFRAEKRAKQRSDASRLEASSSMSLFSPSQSEYQEVFSSDSILESSPSKGKGRSHVTPRPFARPRPPAATKPVADDYDLEEMDVSVGTPQMFAPYTRPLTVSCRKSRPMGNMTMSVARNRSSALICTAEPPDTPPLSIAGSDASSISGGSQGSIDVSRLMGMLGNTSENPTPSGRRTRARGQGHRRLSRSSMAISFTAEDLPCSTSYSYSAFGNSQANDSVMIVDPEAHIAELAEMIEAGIQLSDEQMASVTRYIALRNEAFETVERSQMIWQDTDFSRFALSTFTPPTYQSEIKALIEHSQDTYATLPVEFYKRHHPRYSRSPRISPYPTDVTRSVKSVRTRPANVEQVLSHLPPGYTPARPTRTTQESPMVKNMGTTVVHSSSPAPALTSPTPLSPLTVNLDLKASAVKEKGSKHSLRRTALGWGKRKAVVDAVSPVPPASKTQTTQSSAATVAKENLGIGMLASPSQQTLRVNRPRPKGRSSTSTLRTALRI